MLDTPTILAFIGAVVVLSTTPGPDMALLVSRGIGQGWRAAWYTALGFTLAGLIQIPLLALGLASLFQSSPVLFDLLRYAGAAYLIWRGVQIIRRSGGRDTLGPTNGNVEVGLGAALRDGVIASLTNPKGLVFLLAFLPQFVDPSSGSVTVQLVILGLLLKGIALVVESGICIAAGGVGRFLLQRPRFMVWQERATGAVLIGLGLRLLAMDGSGRR